MVLLPPRNIHDDRNKLFLSLCRPQIQPRPDNAECCGDKAYNTSIEKCCNDTILNIKQILHQQVTSSDQPQHPGSDYFALLPCVECCGDGIMPVNPKLICCDGEIQERPANAECCGRKAFDSQLQFCCDKQIIDKMSYLKVYLSGLQGYLSLFGMSLDEYASNFGLHLGSLLPCMGCCGREPFIESDDKICCEGMLQQKPANGECCGQKAFDSLQMICCDGVPQTRPPNAACCGREAYNSIKDTCCSNATMSTTTSTSTSTSTTFTPTSTTTSTSTTTVTPTSTTSTTTEKPDTPVNRKSLVSRC